MVREEVGLENGTEKQADAQGAASEATSLEGAWESVLRETVNLVESFGRALVTTAQDISNLMVIHLDDHKRDHLDMLVEAGVVDSRRQGAGFLIDEGIKAKQASFERVEAMRARIAALRTQLRESVKLPESA
ncbi:MAG: hypothetical protein JXB35_04925 [Anaerolineae bacterium]|nr:hypothetical protein [Anaerolineae bacterium]